MYLVLSGFRVKKGLCKRRTNFTGYDDNDSLFYFQLLFNFVQIGPADRDIMILDNQ